MKSFWEHSIRILNRIQKLITEGRCKYTLNQVVYKPEHVY